MSEPLYQLAGVTQVYGGRTVLAVDRLHVRRGEILGVVGPSGAGKSTLLRLLNFLEKPAAGEIVFDGAPVAGPSAPAGPPLATLRRVTTVFQEPGLLNRNVRDNVAYGLKLRGRRPVQGQIETLLARLGLAGMGDQPARKLSAGEAQRAALARALVLQPDVLLLDEPTANLDPYNVGLIEELVREVNREQGTTVVWVTHNVFQARRATHRTALLLDGRIVELADTHDFFEQPASPQAAAFVAGELVY